MFPLFCCIRVSSTLDLYLLMKISLAHVVLNMYVCMDTFGDKNNNLESLLRWAMSLLLLLALVLWLVRATLHPDAPAALELSIARTRVLDYL